MSSFEDNRAAAEEAMASLREQVTTIQSGNKAAVQAANAAATNYIREIERCLKGMEAETRAAPPSQRRVKQDQIVQIKQELQTARSSMQQANDVASRAALLEGAKAKEAAMATEARDRMAATTAMASRGTERLQQAQASLLETQEVGINVIDSMQQQREVIIRATDKAAGVSTLTDTARSILNGIQRRAITNKFLLVGAIIILLGMIGLVLYYGYLRPDPTTSSSSSKPKLL